MEFCLPTSVVVPLASLDIPEGCVVLSGVRGGGVRRCGLEKSGKMGCRGPKLTLVSVGLVDGMEVSAQDDLAGSV